MLKKSKIFLVLSALTLAALAMSSAQKIQHPNVVLIITDNQGFDESLIHLSGGMGQPGDFTTFFKNDSSYFDPVLWYNGEQKAYDGYCFDIFANEAVAFIV